ncbi:MAG: creatininase family protein [Candidatus Riflebacteria bacterium]|nr:creatininase family protein [Candidatus Riflebacteria bacterium]
MARPKPTTAPLLLDEMTTPQVEHLLDRRAPLFFPVGTLEAHGRHLPVGTDTLCASGVARELAKRFGGAVAPALPYGLTNLLAQTAPGSFFPDDLYREFVKATLRGFRAHGFDRLVVINGHGGNTEALKHTARLVIRESPVAVCVVNWWLLAEPVARRVYGARGGHAAVEETAAVMTLRPDLVDEGRYSPPTDDFTPEDSIWCYPTPGEVLIYDGDPRGRPTFDRKKAATFMAATLDEIEKRLDRWLRGLGRLRGGLRPAADDLPRGPGARLGFVK